MNLISSTDGSKTPYPGSYRVALIGMRLTTLLIFSFLCLSLGAQDIYDYPHSRAYARYLLQSQQYDLAAEEYERLLFIRPGNDTLRVELLRAYRKGNTPQRGLEQWAKWKLNGQLSKSQALYGEYSRLLLRGGYPAQARELAQQNAALDSQQIRRTLLYADLLEQKWKAAEQTLAGMPSTDKLSRRTEIETLIKKGKKVKKKNPWVATALSVPVPGLGKVYAGEWKDGLISALFVGVNVWQAYRRFDLEGTDTFWGWVHSGFALGFYAGNLYGSHKSARRQNEIKFRKLQHEAESIVFPVLD